MNKLQFVIDTNVLVSSILIKKSRSDAALKKARSLGMAINGKADYLIIGNNDLLVLHPFQGIKIVTVNEFLGKK